jgi:hypothetical protein
LNRPPPAPKAGQKFPFNSGKLLKIQARLVEQSLQNAPAIGTLNGTLTQVQWCHSSTNFSEHLIGRNRPWRFLENASRERQRQRADVRLAGYSSSWQRTIVSEWPSGAWLIRDWFAYEQTKTSVEVIESVYDSDLACNLLPF